MAPLKKPLFAPLPPPTLHHFFPKADALINRSTPSSSKPPKRVKAGVSSSRIKQNTTYTSAEIIVLDSDDDAPAMRTKRKAKDPADSSSDVEVVEMDAQQTHASSSRKKEKMGHGARFGGSGIECLFALPQDESLHFVEFGRPRLLIPTEDTQHSAGGEQSLASGSNFPQDESSVPTSAPLLAAGSGLASDSDSRIFATAPSSCLDNLIKIEDEWDTGDDELVRPNPGEFDDVLELTDDDDEVEHVLKVEDEPLSASGDNTLDQCPFCGRSLTSLAPLDIQSHINNCCDSSSHSAPSPDPLISSHNPSMAPRQSECEKPANCNAFSVLIFRPTKASGGRRKAPFYKVMQGMPIAVDAFCYGAIPGVTSYFLTHAHSDHYTSLSSTWQAGPIYCSEGTANLIIHMLSVDPKWVHPLPMDVPTMVPNSGGVTVTLIEANHCPGSSLFLFEGPQTANAGDTTYTSSYVGSARTFRYLHCGDFRASPQHTLHPSVKDKRIDIIYLDTTYLNPRYLFPAQAQVISACAELSKRLVSGQGSVEDDNGTVSKWFTLIPKSQARGDVKLANTLIVVGTYTIGKERIVKAIAKALDSKIYCDQRKAAILRCQSDPELHEMLTADPFSANVHIVPLNVATSDRLKEYMGRWNGHWTKAGCLPYSPPAGTSSTPSVASTLARPPHRDAQLFGVPYSEHSSFFELTCFALSLDWARVVPTVNVESAASRAKISTWIARWEAERRKRPPGVVPPYRTPEYW
ncbi:DNA cross-link repair protein pso2/snm1 [Lactarius vividus]|nr:DNA cross-link repair protein pso2/snm1 [Lactarius vividus]